MRDFIRMIYCISNGTIRHGVQYLILKYIWPPTFVISLSPDSIDSSMMTIIGDNDCKRFGDGEKDQWWLRGLGRPVWLSKLCFSSSLNAIDLLIFWSSDHLLEGLGPTLVILLLVELLLKLPFLQIWQNKYLICIQIVIMLLLLKLPATANIW